MSMIHTFTSIEAEYDRRRSGFSATYVRKLALGRRLGFAALACLAAALKFAGELFYGYGTWWHLYAALTALALAAVLWQRAKAVTDRAGRLTLLYERALARLRGSATQSGLTGDSFGSDGHLYQRDLNVLGKDSLFGLLATTRTVVGQRALAHILLTTPDADTVRQRQQAVQELAPLLDLREQVALLGQSKFEEVPAESFDNWFAVETGAVPAWVRPVLLTLTLGWVALTLAGLVLYAGLGPFLYPVQALLLAQAALCYWLRPRVLDELAAARPLPGQNAVLRKGLRLMRAQSFTSQRLLDLQRAAEGEQRALSALERHLTIVAQRVKEWGFVFSLLLGLGTQVAISLQRWKLVYAGPMRAWIAAWAEFDALLALATYAVEHPQDVYPQITDPITDPAAEASAPLFAATALRHPLLSRQVAVANNLALGVGPSGAASDTAADFLLISGSNMAGKSTLMRAVGANVVLALAGVPVAATQMRLVPLHIGASLALTDSLAEGKSKFLAEVERLRDIVHLARQHPGRTLFLIDEIFSGTNSADRRAAAEAVLRGLLGSAAIGALSTHDLALAELAEMPTLHGRNVHMCSADDADPLAFDYLLKPGVNRTTNALAIVRLLGL